MDSFVHYNCCPLCDSSLIHAVLRAKDHTASGEEFAIWHCAHCSLRFTQDAPGPQAIGEYYRAEDYISHTNTSKGLINRLYKLIRKRTLRQKRKLVCGETGMNRGRLLDLGSGTGAFVSEMRRHGWEVNGLEPDEGARRIAKEMLNCDLEDLSQFYNLTPGSYDAITLWHVLEHVHDLRKYVRQLRNLLTQNGRLIIAVPNYTSFDAAFYKEFWAAYDVPRHLYHFSPASMKIMMERNEMKIIQHRPMWFDSFYVSLLSSRYRNTKQPSGAGRSNWLSALWIGFVSNINALGDANKCSSVIYVAGK